MRVLETSMPGRGFAARGALLLSFLFVGVATATAQPSQGACFSTDASTSLDLRIDACTSVIQSKGLSQDRLAIAFQNRGIAYLGKGDTDRAIQDYDQAIKLDPKYANAFNSRGIAYQAKGDNQRAIEDYGEAIRLDPRNANALNGRCWVRAASGQLQAALADCNESLQLRPNNSILWTLAPSYISGSAAGPTLSPIPTRLCEPIRQTHTRSSSAVSPSGTTAIWQGATRISQPHGPSIRVHRWNWPASA